MLFFWRNLAVINGVQFELDKVADLCRRYHVRRLAAFGSMLRSDFEPGRSDFDLVVEFEPEPAAIRLQNYLKLRDELACLFSRPVDLIEEGAIRNPYIIQRVKDEQQLLYAA